MRTGLFSRQKRHISDASLKLAHEEILRLRDRQNARTASIRARNTGVLGASGVAASLVTTLSDNPLYAFAIACFALATIMCVRAMTVQTLTVKHPVGVLQAVADKDAFESRLAIIKHLRTEYDSTEAGLVLLAARTRIAMAWFSGGTIALLFVSALPPIAAISRGGG